jgi:copper chaperone CopZ
MPGSTPQFSLDSDAIGGAINSAKGVKSLRYSIKTGTAKVKFSVGPVGVEQGLPCALQGVQL